MVSLIPANLSGCTCSMNRQTKGRPNLNHAIRLCQLYFKIVKGCWKNLMLDPVSLKKWWFMWSSHVCSLISIATFSWNGSSCSCAGPTAVVIAPPAKQIQHWMCGNTTNSIKWEGKLANCFITIKIRKWIGMVDVEKSWTWAEPFD
jgi:hypothetical protein